MLRYYPNPTERGYPMSKAQNEISELMALQREATAPRSKRRKADRTTRSAEDTALPLTGDPEPASASDAAGDSEMSELEKTMKELSDNLEYAVQEIEEAAREQPALTALVAFTLGLVVGQLISRR
jgi:hypothetical protein